MEAQITTDKLPDRRDPIQAGAKLELSLRDARFFGAAKQSPSRDHFNNSGDCFAMKNDGSQYA